MSVLWQRRPRAGSGIGLALLLLFGLSLLPRLVLLGAAARAGASLEAWEYEELATSVAAGGGYVISRLGGHPFVAFGDGNLYTFLAAAVYLVLGHTPWALGVVQALLAALIAPIVFCLGREAFGPRVALAGAALAALHPAHLVYTLKLHPLGMDVLLLALLALLVVRLRPTVGGLGAHARVLLPVGLVLGLCLMTRPTFFVAGVAALGVRVLARAVPVRGAIVVVGVAALVAAPWVARNWALLGRPLLISTGTEDLWKGSNPLASGTGHMPSGRPIIDGAPREFRARVMAAGELGQDAVYGEAFAQFVRERPAEFFALAGRKATYFWWASPQTGLLYPKGWMRPYLAYYAVSLGLAVVGAWAILAGGTRRERALLALLLALFATITLVHAVAYVEGRHRWGIEPLLLLLTARGAAAVAMGAQALGLGVRVADLPSRPAVAE